MVHVLQDKYSRAKIRHTVERKCRLTYVVHMTKASDITVLKTFRTKNGA